MKPTYLLAGLLSVYIPVAAAVDFNKDAMKTLQEEGHKIADENTGARAFKLSGGHCLQAPSKNGASLLLKKCNSKNNQKWQLDGQGRIMAHAGGCVDVAGGNAVLQKCGGAKSQQWKHDGKNRLVSGGKKCLQGDAASGKVAAAACGNPPDQIWQ